MHSGPKAKTGIISTRVGTSKGELPIFIIGSHRSGTSILYRILAASGCFNVVTAFHVLNRFILPELHASGTIESAKQQMAEEFKSRGLHDEYGKEVTPDTLEEYCFALDHQGRRPTLRGENRPGFISFCEQLQSIEKPGRPLLLKNPYDTRNFNSIHKAFPESRFIFIHRHPVRIIDSQLRLIRQIMAERSDYDALMHDWYRNIYDNCLSRWFARRLCSERIPILFRLVFENVSRNCDYIVANFDRLGQATTGVTYSQLCEDPGKVVRTILRFLGLDERRSPDYAKLIRMRQSILLPEVEKRKVAIEQRNCEYRRKFGV